MVFPSPTGHVLNDNTGSKLLRELGIGAGPHGFLSSFRDWAVKVPTCRERSASSLWGNSDRVEAAYRRSDLLERRRDLIEDWFDYLYASP